MNLSWALNALGHHQEALDASDQAINLKESAPAYTNRGWALQAFKHYSQALQAHEKALALDPNFAPAYKGKGDALFVLGEMRLKLVLLMTMLSSSIQALQMFTEGKEICSRNREDFKRPSKLMKKQDRLNSESKKWYLIT